MVITKAKLKFRKKVSDLSAFVKVHIHEFKYFSSKEQVTWYMFKTGVMNYE